MSGQTEKLITSYEKMDEVSSKLNSVVEQLRTRDIERVQTMEILKKLSVILVEDDVDKVGLSDKIYVDRNLFNELDSGFDTYKQKYEDTLKELEDIKKKYKLKPKKGKNKKSLYIII
eukprot:TRINITY_DN5506_c0_g1_i1.p2 TRINITY_DN5506_c0_g1~~TRINITY_DN5506_c0_g1_i1.p2  ORF type:complete len:117 (+),score=21.17 TRINITY_DN5506_c0_g1_i1:633-983(+)